MAEDDGLSFARKLIDRGALDEAWAIGENLLKERPEFVPSLTLLSYIAWKAGKYVIGYVFGCQAVSKAPNDAIAWLNLGINASDLWLWEEANFALKTAVRLSRDKEIQGMAYMNLAAHCINFGKFAKGEEYAMLAMKGNPHSAKAKANLGMALLGQNKWEGWKYYSYCLGTTAYREKMKFGEEPDWDGSHDKTVAFYGEQGLGDELSFASMLPDAIRDCKKVILSCDKKLEGLFKRSFPKARVYGTRRAKASDGIQWNQEDWQIDASLALGELGQLYRTTNESFTGEPYLIPDPDRRRMWRALFDSKSKPCIGIAWAGGMPHTGEQYRTIHLDGMRQILESFDAHWISLQYKDSSKEIAAFTVKHPRIEFKQYPTGTLTADYDDTAAMVAELDLVITVQTAIVHLCGAIGKECWVLLPKNSQWRYGEEGDGTIWYKSVKVFRQRAWKDWLGPMGEITDTLVSRFKKAEAA